MDGKESNYMVSNAGVILNSVKNKQMGSIPNKYNGYRSVTLTLDGKCHVFGIHVLVALYFCNKPDVEDGVKLEVNHKDGNKLNNHAYNLEWVTRKENIIHAFKTGLNKANPKLGVEHWNAKTDEDTIHKICKMIEDGYDSITISSKLNVPRTLISHIKYHDGWSCIASKYNIKNKYSLNLSQILPQKSKKYPEELIRNICSLIESGKDNKYISEKLSIKEGMVSDIRAGKIWRFYSEQYNINYGQSYKPSKLYLLVTECLDQDITSTNEIIEYHKLPDVESIHQYIDNLKCKYMK